MPNSSRRLAGRSALLALVVLSCLGFRDCDDPAPLRVIALEAGADLEFRLREALLLARPGDEILVPEGTYDIHQALSISVPNVTLRGEGSSRSVLNFGGRDTGAQGILVSADAITITDLAVEDTAGDGIKIQGAEGVRLRRLRVEWTGGPSTTNGAYGIYPVQCQNVLISTSIVIGASDAGIYVGQSQDIVVRWNTVEYNVAGIEIENSLRADVYNNVVRYNTGGILVFDLPGLSMQGSGSRIYRNWIVNNNTPNFAPEGNVVAIVPKGTGLMIMSTDSVEIFENNVLAHDTANVLVVSYIVTGLSFPPSYDPYPESIHIHDNRIRRGGLRPDGLGAVLGTLFLPGAVPSIVWDGIMNGDLVQGDGELPLDLRLCVTGNEGADFGRIDIDTLSASRDVTPHLCSRTALSPVALAPVPDPPPFTPPFTEEQIAFLCGKQEPGINRDALVVDCPELSDYRLFANSDPTADPNDGGLPFDLTTPLFSDYANKHRFVFVPPGESATYTDAGAFDFPVGTVIAKTFGFLEDRRQPELGERLIETRLLIHREDGWIGLPYIWDETETVATLAIGGGSADVSWIDLAGQLRATTYQVPNINECTDCHGTQAGDKPIGLQARWLNLDYDYAGGTQNQLQHWSDRLILSGAPSPASAPRQPVWDDPLDGSVEERARAYLDINCAHCHDPAGVARFSGLFLEAERPLGSEVGECKPPVAAGAGSGGRSYDIVPGEPSDSILVFRMESLLPSIRMPEISRSIVHDEGVALVSSWILGLPGSCD